MLNKFERAPYPEHPNRCQAVGKNGQCPFLGRKNDEGEYTKNCPRHSGMSIVAEKSKEYKMYQLAKWQVRMDRQVDHPSIKNLREEIGILRMTMEEKLNSIHDSTDLLLNTQSLTSLVREIRDTVTACNKVELSTNQMLDKNQAFQFVKSIVDILQNYISDADILQMISEDMIQVYDTLIVKG